MGAVVSCVQSIFRTIGRVLMAIVNGIGSIIMAIVNGIVTLFDIIISCVTCQGCGSRRSGRRMGSRHHATTRSAI